MYLCPRTSGRSYRNPQVKKDLDTETLFISKSSTGDDSVGFYLDQDDKGLRLGPGG